MASSPQSARLHKAAPTGVLSLASWHISQLKGDGNTHQKSWCHWFLAPHAMCPEHSQASADMQVSPTSGPIASSPAKWAALSGLRQASRRTVPAASSWHRGSAASSLTSMRGRPGRCMTALRFTGSRVSACSCHRTWLLRWRAAGSPIDSPSSSSSTSCRAGLSLCFVSKQAHRRHACRI